MPLVFISRTCDTGCLSNLREFAVFIPQFSKIFVECKHVLVRDLHHLVSVEPVS